MAKYTYQIPVIVRYYESEDDILLPTRKSAVDFVHDQIVTENPFEFESYPVKFTVKASRREGVPCVVVTAQTSGDAYSERERNEILKHLNTQCRYGFGETGWQLEGHLYGYNKDWIHVAVYDRGVGVKCLDKDLDEEKVQ